MPKATRSTGLKSAYAHIGKKNTFRKAPQRKAAR
jgi:hypothetical protein